MMNEERVGVGLGAASIASAAYYAALEYCRERPQGRRITSKDPATPQMPIINHADVKRMLLFQRAVVEGSISLLMQCCQYEDKRHVVDQEENEKYDLLLDLLTPVAKTYPSEMGILSTSSSIQCFGGYGYCEDFPVEQHFRDMRIHPIHEGTTGIQGMDLLGRKVVMKNGRAFKLFMKEVQGTIGRAREFSALEKISGQLDQTMTRLQDVTLHLGGVAMEKGPEVFLSDATLYLEMFGIITIAWQWLLQSIAVQEALGGDVSTGELNFYRGKMFAARYFFAYELPKISGLANRLTDSDPITMEMKTEYFAD